MRVGKESIWEAIGPARDAFEILAPEIKNYLERSIEPISCWVSWSVYMIGRAIRTAKPTIIFCCENLRHRRDIRKAIKDSGILDLYPGFKTGHMPRPPDFDQLVPLAHGKLASGSELLTVLAKLSDKACGMQLLINGSTPSGVQSVKRATVGGVIFFNNKYFYTTAGHPFATEVDDDSDAFSFDGDSVASEQFSSTKEEELEEQVATRNPGGVVSDYTQHTFDDMLSANRVLMPVLPSPSELTGQFVASEEKSLTAAVGAQLPPTGRGNAMLSPQEPSDRCG